MTPTSETIGQGKQYQRDLSVEVGRSLVSISDLIRKPQSRILDLGCGPGTLGQYLAGSGHILDGVEYDASSAKAARKYYRQVVVASLESELLADVLPIQTYDYIICADILEHVREPSFVLNQLTSMLVPGGRLLISMPNVAHAGLIASLMAGEFTYGPEGLLDETHLRFFTRSSLFGWLSEHGFKARLAERITMDVRDSEFAHRYVDLFPPAVQRALLAQPEALTYQFIVEAMPMSDPGAQRLVPSIADEQPELVFAGQIFWWQDNRFHETWSSHARGRIGVDRQAMSFTIPLLETPSSRLRIMLVDRPGLLKIYTVRIYTGSGELLWQWQANIASMEKWDMREVALIDFSHSDQAIKLLVAGEDSFIELATPELERFYGGRVEVDLGWPMSSDYLALARQCVPRRDLHSLRERLDEVLTSVDQHESALGSLSSECEVLTVKARKLREELETTKTELGNERCETASLRQMLDNIYSSSLWRYSRPLVNIIDRIRGKNR